MTRIVVLISGRGSNMQAIVRACTGGEINADVVSVIANRAEAAGLQFAQENDINTDVCDHTQYSDRKSFDHALKILIDRAEPDWIVLAGFMRVLGAELVQGYVGRMINIHPSLLPKYPGLNTHDRALAAGDTTHGATVHFVTPELDAGPMIEQVEVPVLPGDTSDTLAARVLEQEHALLIHALKRCVNGEIKFTGTSASG